MNSEQANADRAENKVDPQSIDAAHEELAERKDRIAAMDRLVREIVSIEAPYARVVYARGSVTRARASSNATEQDGSASRPKSRKGSRNEDAERGRAGDVGTGGRTRSGECGEGCDGARGSITLPVATRGENRSGSLVRRWQEKAEGNNDGTTSINGRQSREGTTRAGEQQVRGEQMRKAIARAKGIGEQWPKCPVCAREMQQVGGGQNASGIAYADFECPKKCPIPLGTPAPRAQVRGFPGERSR